MKKKIKKKLTLKKMTVADLGGVKAGSDLTTLGDVTCETDERSVIWCYTVMMCSAYCPSFRVTDCLPWCEY